MNATPPRSSSGQSYEIPDHRKRASAKETNKALIGQWTAEERMRDMHRLLIDLDQRLSAVETKVDAVLRRNFLNGAGLDPLQRIQAHRFPMFSQHEEAGMLTAIFEEVGASSRTFVDIGCGVNGGNSGFLALECGWRGLMVDEAGQCMDAIRERFVLPNVKPVEWSVTAENVNDLFTDNGLQGDIDLLSLDIDSVDYWIWKAISAVQPRVVVLEYNSIFGPDAAVTIPYDSSFDRRQQSGMGKQYYGASLQALSRLSEAKGYRLILTDPSGANAFFLRQDVAPQIPGRTVGQVFRYMPKHRAGLRKMGMDAVAYYRSQKLELVEVG